MSSSHFTFYIWLITCALFLQTTFGVNPLFYFCLSSAGNFTSNSSYESNLNYIPWIIFNYNQTYPQGFGFNSVGFSPNQTYGLSLCQCDVMLVWMCVPNTFIILYFLAIGNLCWAIKNKIAVGQL